MIPDSQTNFLFLADCLPEKYPDFYRGFGKILDECNIAYDLLPGTKDIWAVDYMPVQVSNKRYVQFVYEPDYLKSAKWQKTKSDADSICKAINVNPEQSNIVIDGGNVIRSAQAVIVCDKVFRENPEIKERQLIKELENIFEVDKIYFIPQDQNDFTGHADGMVRFLDENTVLINDYSGERPEFQSAFRMSLHNAGLEYIELPYYPDERSNDSAMGLYLNYLQMEHVIFVPTFGIKSDATAIKQFEFLFKDHTIRAVPSTGIATQGGVLNCISWNIRK